MTIIELQYNGDPYGSGFTGCQSDDEKSWVYRGDIGAQSREWWRNYCRRNHYTLREAESYPRQACWHLINNGSHQTLKFTSQNKLRTYAKENGLAIKKSYTNDRCFYTDSFEHVPGGR